MYLSEDDMAAVKHFSGNFLSTNLFPTIQPIVVKNDYWSFSQIRSSIRFEKTLSTKKIIWLEAERKKGGEELWQIMSFTTPLS